MILLMFFVLLGNLFCIGNEDYFMVEEFYVFVKMLFFVYVLDIKWYYGNIGYVLLVILIDEVSGKMLWERLFIMMFKEFWSF